jgi:F0F1-type ATP synthase assembly protein I
MDYAGRTAIGELALQQAGRTEDTADDRAAYAFQEELLKRRKQRLQKELAEVRAKLRKRHSAAEEKKLLGRQSSLLGELGSVEGGLSGVREGRRGLDEGGEAEEDPAIKAAEEQQRAAEELKASIDALAKEVAQQNAINSSELAIGLREAKRALADMVTGQIGPKVAQASLATGIGTVGSS